MRSKIEIENFIEALKIDFSRKQYEQERALNNSLNYVDYCKEFDRIELQKNRIILKISQLSQELF